MFGLRMQELRNRNVKESNVFALERSFYEPITLEQRNKDTHLHVYGHFKRLWTPSTIIKMLDESLCLNSMDLGGRKNISLLHPPVQLFGISVSMYISDIVPWYL